MYSVIAASYGTPILSHRADHCRRHGHDLDAKGWPSGTIYRHYLYKSTNVLFFDGHAETRIRGGLTKRNFVSKR